MKTAKLLRGPVERPSVLGRATGDGRRNSEYMMKLWQVALGAPGKCARKPVMVVCLFDNSGSVTGGNDPLGHRYDEINYALQKVGRKCSCHQCMAAIIHFDVPTDGDVPPTPISRKGMARLEEGLKVPMGGGTSNLGPSLSEAYKVAAPYQKSHHMVLVVATDFELFDTDVNGVMQRVVDFPGQVHALVLNTEPRPILTEASNVTVSRVDPRSQVGDVAKALFATVVNYRVGAKPALPLDEPLAAKK